MQMILYGLCGEDDAIHFSPHVWKVIMALHHKGLSYAFRPVPFTEIPKLEDGFSQTVPILRDGDRLVRDSFDIALYLEDTYPDAPSLFKGEGGRGMARVIEGFSQTVIHPALTKIAVADIHNLLAPTDRVYFRKSREARLGQTLEELATNRFTEAAEFPRKLEPIRAHVKLPIGVGFGIRDEATAKAVAKVADAVVIGSRIIQELEQNPKEQAVDAVRAFVARIRKALDE